jgi:hypothetical protein
VVSSIEYIGQFNPIGWCGERPATHKELQCFHLLWHDLVGAAVWGLQSLELCVLAEKDVRTLVEVVLPEFVWGGPCTGGAEWSGALVPQDLMLESVARLGFLGQGHTKETGKGNFRELLSAWVERYWMEQGKLSLL